MEDSRAPLPLAVIEPKLKEMLFVFRCTSGLKDSYLWLYNPSPSCLALKLTRTVLTVNYNILNK